jgi:hypothetical protein
MFGSLLGELRIRGDTPTPSPGQADPQSAQLPPDLMRAHIAQRFGQQRAGPGGRPFRRDLIQLRQQSRPRCVVIDRDPTGPEIIGQAGQPLLVEAHSPFANACGTGVQALGNSLIGQTVRRPKNDARTLHMAGLGFGLAQPACQLGAFSGGEMNVGCSAHHARLSSIITLVFASRY